MPRDGSNIYHRPAGTDGVPNFPIESSKYNAYVADVEQDLNLPRPIVAGGTGANNATDALFNVKGEIATQIVTNWDSQVWVPGSFYAASTATGAAPVAGHAFAGQAYIGEALANPPTNQNVIVEARDLDSLVQPGVKYTRQKKAGVWSPWDQASAASDQAGFRQTIYAAPFDALAYNGMQVNGSMEVAQEQTSTAVNNKYAVDGWMLGFNGATAPLLSQQPSVGTFTGFEKYLAVQFGSPGAMGSSDYVAAVHTIEGYRCSRLAWGSGNAQSLTICFWSCHTAVGTYSIAVRNNGFSRAYITSYTQNVANVPEFKTITIPGDIAGTWVKDNGAGIILHFVYAAGSSNITPTPNAWVTTPPHYIAVSGQVNLAGAVNTGRIAGLVVLPGIEVPSAARSPLIMRPFDQELMTCQRYWQTINPLFFTGYNVAGGTLDYTIPYPTTMRAPPTVTFPTVGYANASGATTVSVQVSHFIFRITLTATGNAVFNGSCALDARL